MESEKSDKTCDLEGITLVPRLGSGIVELVNIPLPSKRGDLNHMRISRLIAQHRFVPTLPSLKWLETNNYIDKNHADYLRTYAKRINT